MYAKQTPALVLASLSLLMFLAPPATADTTMVLFQHDTQQNVADLGEPGPGPGDQLLFAGDVFDRPGGALMGTASGSCTTVTGNDTAGQTACSAMYNLGGGQIMVAGLVDTAALLTRGDPVPLSIIGGTGMYQDASGDGTIQVPPDVPNQTDANLVFNLTTA
jgi:hypothetical protein